MSTSKKHRRLVTTYRGARRNAARTAGLLRNWQIDAQKGRPSNLAPAIIKVLRNDQKRGAAGRWFSGKKAA